MIIGLSGKAGAGKDTVAAIIQKITREQYKQVWKNKKFSYKLKLIASILTGDSIELFESQEGKSEFLPLWNKTRREILLDLGTKAIRDGLDTDAWIKALFADYSSAQNWIVTDVRFPNEFEAVKKAGGFVVRIERFNNPFPVINHESETALDSAEFDCKLFNGDSLEELEGQVERMLMYLIDGVQPLCT